VFLHDKYGRGYKAGIATAAKCIIDAASNLNSELNKTIKNVGTQKTFLKSVADALTRRTSLSDILKMYSQDKTFKYLENTRVIYGPYHYPQVIFASVFLRSVSQGCFLLRRKERMEGLKKHGN